MHILLVVPKKLEILTVLLQRSTDTTPLEDQNRNLPLHYLGDPRRIRPYDWISVDTIYSLGYMRMKSIFGRVVEIEVWHGIDLKNTDQESALFLWKR